MTLRSLRVALVEDDPSLRDVLRVSLAERGARVTTFADGGDALLALFDDLDADVVLSDVRLPRFDGLSLCGALRDRHPRAPLRVVLMSGASRLEDQQAALEAGADDYLAKPFSPAQLLRKLAPGGPSRARAPTSCLVDPRAPLRLGRFDLLGYLGRGAYGAVYRARDRADGQEVALKLLARDLNDDRGCLLRLLREVSVLGRVRSPHVVGVRGAGFERGRYFLSLELVPGQALDVLLDERGHLALESALGVGRDLCAAVEALQACGLVHRDIKPSNAILRPTGGCTLLDFGLAKSGGEQGVTAPGELMGTVPYMAPELLTGQPHHVGSDLYSVGATVWELVVGVPPFSARTELEVMEAIASGVAASALADLVPEVEPAVSELVARLMEPDPARRLCDPVAARAAFEEALAGARPPTRRARAVVGSA